MKATGIVRRIDELGRIVIPKEIRKTLRIKDGENLEIYVAPDESIILKKHSLLKKMESFAQDLCDSVYAFIKENIIITDSDKIIAVAGELKKKLIDQELSDEIDSKIIRREEMLEKHIKPLTITNDVSIECVYAISPVIINGDCQGSVMIISKNKSIDETTFKITQIISEFIKKNIEM